MFEIYTFDRTNLEKRVLAYEKLLEKVVDIIGNYPSTDSFKPNQTAAYIYHEIEQIKRNTSDV